ncbi:hypothetical protein BGZ52_010723 [Haplosporangium bisporale]|nr:hypothetical protein BGZ52_010723 [Haplosporangium bisporale]
MSMAQDDNSPLTQGLLAPSLEPNDKQPKENEEDGIPITLDELLTEIKRLAQHDFTIKGVHYHPVLKGIFQRLCDYDVMLKNARKKVERAVPASPKTSAAISSDSLRAQVKNYAEEVSALEQRLAQIEAESKSDKESLARTSSRLQQALDHGVEETLDMIDHMEKEHKTKSGALKSNLLKSQRATIRLQNEVAAMALRIVRIQTLNEGLEESAERDQAEIARLTKEVEEHKEEIHKIRSEHVSLSPPSDARTNDQETKELKENMTALEIQLEEVTATLRLKELELEHALKETEKVMLQLEELEAKLERELATQKDGHVEEMARFDQEKRGQAQRERAAQVASVTLFQNMVTRLQAELNDTQEKLRDMTLCWGHTKEQLMKCDASYRRRKKELDETTKALHEVNETVAHLSDAIELLEKEKRSNMVLVQTIAKRDQALANMEYRVKQLEEERL